MCEKCDELRKRFQETESITERQSFWREYNKQRKKCEGNLGILAPKKKNAEVTVQKKTKKQKPKPKEEEHIENADQRANDQAPKSKEHCKYLYKGGLCTNVDNKRPYCEGVEKCTLIKKERG